MVCSSYLLRKYRWYAQYLGRPIPKPSYGNPSCPCLCTARHFPTLQARSLSVCSEVVSECQRPHQFGLKQRAHPATATGSELLCLRERGRPQEKIQFVDTARLFTTMDFIVPQVQTRLGQRFFPHMTGRVQSTVLKCCGEHALNLIIS